MKQSKNLRAFARATTIAGAVVIVVSGVTFAALQSQQDALTGNTIETATANLQLSTDGATYSNSRAGFDFNNLIPGGPALPVAGYPIYLKNAGGTPLALKFAVTGTPSNPANVDLSKLSVIVTAVAGGTPPQTFNLQSLLAAATSGGLDIAGDSLKAGTSQQYKLQVSMASDAISGSSAALGNIDFAFSGIAQAN